MMTFEGFSAHKARDVRIKQSNAAKEMLNFPHLEGIKEGKYISQANQLNISPSYCSSYISCSRIQDYRLQSDLPSHEEKVKSTVQVLHEKGSNCNTRVLFHRTELIHHSVLSMNFFFKSVRSQSKVHCFYFCVSRGTTSCQFRSAQQQNTIWTLLSKELIKLLLKFLGPKLKLISPNQVFTPLKKSLNPIN